MTYSFGDIKLKLLHDDHLNEDVWILFRQSITEPLLLLPDFTMQRIAVAVIEAAKQRSTENAQRTQIEP